jgi:hypothetical protein
MEKDNLWGSLVSAVIAVAYLIAKIVEKQEETKQESNVSDTRL